MTTGMETERMGRCARLAWDHAVEARSGGRIERPGVMTAHLLLGVLKEPACAGGLILAKMGVGLAVVLAHTEFVLLHGRRRDGGDDAPVDYAGVPHTLAARAVLDYSLEEAALFSETYPIGTEHILLGLLRVPAGAGCRVLGFFGIDEARARSTHDEFWQVLRLEE